MDEEQRGSERLRRYREWRVQGRSGLATTRAARGVWALGARGARVFVGAGGGAVRCFTLELPADSRVKQSN